ncbi:MAG: hypothetical protein CL902_00565, partial [Dehalococcoidia bacterium]|nr:hypothetical protein [Dehalococcoidia bacterium]
MFARTVPVSDVPLGFQQILDSRGDTNHIELLMSNGSERVQIDDDDFNRNVFPALLADSKMREGYSYPCIYKVDTKDRGIFDVRITDFSVGDRTVTLTLSIREPAFYLRPFMGQWHTGASHRVATEDVMRFFAGITYPDWLGHAKRAMVNDGHTTVIPHVESVTRQRIRQWEDSVEATRPAVADLASVTLLPHQRSCVAWMMRQEHLGIGHDMWQELEGGIWYNALLDTFLPCQPVFSGGGILADIMGLGKTITTLALVANSSTTGPTLVVVPVTLVGQWEAEARRALPAGSRIIVYHGPRRPRNADTLSAATVVITTYEVLASDDTLWRRRHTGSSPYVPPLAGVYWARVVADEAHRLRETFTTRFSAIKALRARSRWCITGTPTTMTVDDLYGPLVFLRHTHLFLPVSYRCGTPALWRDLTRRGVNVVCRVIEGVMWRYAEIQASIGQEITHHDHPIALSDSEMSLYRTHTPTRVRGLPILTLLRAMTTMRRLCNGDSSDSRVAGSVEFTKRIRRALRATPPSDPCPVCLEPADVAVAVGRCGHILCASCTEEILVRQTSSNRCPLCRAHMAESGMTIVHDTTPEPADPSNSPCAPDEKPSKLSYLINHVRALTASGE